MTELRGRDREPVVRITSPSASEDSCNTKSTVVLPETVTVFEEGANPTNETLIVTDPLGTLSEYLPSASVVVPLPPPAVKDAPEIPLPELSETLPLTVF